MTSAGALTVIAICFAVLTLLVLGAGIMILIIALRVIRLEQTIAKEISEIKGQLAGIMHVARESTSRLGQTVQEVRTSAYRVGLVAAGITGFLQSRRGAKTAPRAKARPWWVSGLAFGYSLWKDRRRSQPSQPPSSHVSS